MKKKHKKKLIKFLVSIITMLFLTAMGYFTSGLEENTNMLPGTRYTRNIF